MAGTHYTLDRQGDTILTLKNPSPLLLSPEWDQLPPEKAPDDEADIGDTSMGDMEVEEDETVPDVRFKVSSRRLILASQYFRTMFSGPWSESQQVEDGATHNMTAEGFNEQALLIVLRIIHGLTRNIPRDISLPLAGAIATIVDYYGCHDSVEGWWHREKPVARTELNNLALREQILRLFVAWVFGEDDVFQYLTANLLATHHERMMTFGLPLPPDFCDRFKSTQQQWIRLILLRISKTLKRYRQGEKDKDCTFVCRAARLGVLQINLQNENLLDEHGQLLPAEAVNLIMLGDFLRKLGNPTQPCALVYSLSGFSGKALACKYELNDGSQAEKGGSHWLTPAVLWDLRPKLNIDDFAHPNRASKDQDVEQPKDEARSAHVA